jgi:predicted helicase
LQYNNFIPLFNKEGDCIFSSKTPGIKTDRDEWAYHASKEKLIEQIKSTIDFYNSEVERLQNHILQNHIKKSDINIDNFVNYYTDKIKWSRDLKKKVLSGKKTTFTENKIVLGLFRPFTTKYLYYDNFITDLPSNVGELIQFENQFIAINGLGSQRPFGCYITDLHPDHNITAPSQIFSLYYYKNTKKEFNITNWILTKVQTETNDNKITKEQIFYYVYGILHHEHYRKTYAELLKSSEPKIPLITEKFHEISEIGNQLAKIHLNFNSAKEFKLKIIENKAIEKHYNIEKIVISKKDGTLIYNDCFSAILPDNIHDYKICGRSPIQWFCDQYSNLELKNDEYIKLLKKLVTISLETIEYIKTLNNIDINK